MTQSNIPVWITGLGLLSSLGEGPDAHWEALQGGKPLNVDLERFAPYPVHALQEPDWATQISRRDMRQMEPWQQIGTYAAGLALDDANAKDEELCGRMDMIVAAGGGERDVEVDTAIMQGARETNDRDALLTERLSNDLRPTLFLAQLSNLLAGNISIVHKVTGSSRTFMGEEGAGISAIQTAAARIASGQSDIVLVGGAYNAERADMMLIFELGQYMTKSAKPIWSRTGEDAGFAVGSVGAFLVLESEAHAKARGVTPYAKLRGVVADHGSRSDGEAAKRMDGAIDCLPVSEKTAILSGATGCDGITAEESAFLMKHLPGSPVRGYGTILGHSLEAHFPMGVAMAALAMKHNHFYPPFEPAEQATDDAPKNILVSTFGHYRSEGLALVETVDA